MAIPVRWPVPGTLIGWRYLIMNTVWLVTTLLARLPRSRLISRTWLLGAFLPRTAAKFGRQACTRYISQNMYKSGRSSIRESSQLTRSSRRSVCDSHGYSARDHVIARESQWDRRNNVTWPGGQTGGLCWGAGRSPHSLVCHAATLTTCSGLFLCWEPPALSRYHADFN